MKTLMDALRKQGLGDVTEDQAISAVNAMGFDIDRLTQPQMAEVIKSLSGGLTVAAPSGTATTAKGRKPKQAPAPGNGISQLASKKTQEMQAIQGQILGAIADEVDYHVSDALAAIEDMPVDFLRQLEQRAGEAAKEPANFSESVGQFTRILFPNSEGLRS